MNDLTEIKKKLSELLYTDYGERSAIKEIIQTLKNIFTSSQFPSEDIYDMIGELMMTDPEHFMKHLYPKIVKRLMQTVDFEEMDEYILKKYCFLEDEDIIAKFPGTIASSGYITTGQAYLTKYRIIGCGTQKKVKGGTYFPGMSLLATGISVAVGSAKMSQQRKALAEALGKEISDMGKWGYEFPIDDVVGINPTKRSIFYIKILYNGNPPFKMKVGVHPYNKSASLYKAERKEAINQVNQLLQKYATKKICSDCNVLMDPIEPTKFYFDFYKCPNCRKIIKQKKALCPNCRIFMEFLENESTYPFQCPKCKKKFKIKN